ncbi:MAG: hypothetical protein ACRDJP_15185 [Actinomycetota bacterium]
MPDEFVHQPIEGLGALVDHRVRFIVIGGFAAQLHGSSLLTKDTDVCYARDDENLERLTEALRDLRARLRGAPRDVPFVLDAKTLKMGDSFTFVTEVGAFDFLGTPSGIRGGYDELERAAVEFDLGGFTVKVASIDDLIRMKRAAGRPRDLAMVEDLGALRDEIDRRNIEERRRRRKSAR